MLSFLLLKVNVVDLFFFIQFIWLVAQLVGCWPLFQWRRSVSVPSSACTVTEVWDVSRVPDGFLPFVASSLQPTPWTQALLVVEVIYKFGRCFFGCLCVTVMCAPWCHGDIMLGIHSCGDDYWATPYFGHYHGSSVEQIGHLGLSWMSVRCHLDVS